MSIGKKRIKQLEKTVERMERELTSATHYIESNRQALLEIFYDCNRLLYLQNETKISDQEKARQTKNVKTYTDAYNSIDDLLETAELQLKLARLTMMKTNVQLMRELKELKELSD